MSKYLNTSMLHGSIPCMPGHENSSIFHLPSAVAVAFYEQLLTLFWGEQQPFAPSGCGGLYFFAHL